MFDTINFTMAAESRQGNDQTFRDLIDWIVANGIGGATFEAAEMTRSAAHLQGSIVGDPRLVTESGLAEYLADVLDRKEGIGIKITAHLTSRCSELPAEQAAAAA